MVTQNKTQKLPEGNLVLKQNYSLFSAASCSIKNMANIRTSS